MTHETRCCLDPALDLRVGTGILHPLVQSYTRNQYQQTGFELVVEYSTDCATAVTFPPESPRCRSYI